MKGSHKIITLELLVLASDSFLTWISPETMMNDKVTCISCPPGVGRGVSDPSETGGEKLRFKDLHSSTSTCSSTGPVDGRRTLGCIIRHHWCTNLFQIDFQQSCLRLNRITEIDYTIQKIVRCLWFPFSLPPPPHQHRSPDYLSAGSPAFSLHVGSFERSPPV